MEKIITLYKEIGETPLEAIHRFKMEHSKYADLKMTYAGRLDPMAEGLLLVLADDYVHKKDKYTALSKEYEFEMLYGVATDTYDILGLITSTSRDFVSMEATELLLPQYTGEITQKYPPFSSKTVDGKPLFMWAREGKLYQIEIPEHKVTINSLTIEGVQEIEQSELRNRILEKIQKVSGDFRQHEIIHLWKERLTEEMYYAAKMRMQCSSGTYVRQLVHDIGQGIGTPTTTLSIKRTKVGDFAL